MEMQSHDHRSCAELKELGQSQAMKDMSVPRSSNHVVEENDDRRAEAGKGNSVSVLRSSLSHVQLPLGITLPIA